MNSCFSPDNFDIVYSYIEMEISKKRTNYYEINDFEIYLVDKNQIDFRKDNFTLSRVTREKGLFAIVKDEKGNLKITREINKLFCEILSYKT